MQRDLLIQYVWVPGVDNWDRGLPIKGYTCTCWLEGGTTVIVAPKYEILLSISYHCYQSQAKPLSVMCIYRIPVKHTAKKGLFHPLTFHSLFTSLCIHVQVRLCPLQKLCKEFCNCLIGQNWPVDWWYDIKLSFIHSFIHATPNNSVLSNQQSGVSLLTGLTS